MKKIFLLLSGAIMLFLFSCSMEQKSELVTSSVNEDLLTAEELSHLSPEDLVMLERVKANGGELDLTADNAGRFNAGSYQSQYENLFYYGNIVQAEYAKANTNLTYKKSVKASAELSYEPAVNAVNGTHNASLRDKWCTGYGNGSNQWLEIDLGKYYWITHWRIFNQNIYNPPTYNNYCTKYWKVQYLRDNQWIDAYYYYNSGNEATVEKQFLYPIVAQKIRLWVYTGDYDNCVRIPEFKVYNRLGYIPEPGDILVTYESTPDHSGLVYDSDYSIEATSDGVAKNTIGKWTDPARVYGGKFYAMRVKNSTLQEGRYVATYANSKIGYPYNYDLSDYKNTSKFYCNSLVYRAWRSGIPGKSYNLDSDVWFPPLTVSDLIDDNDTYKVYSGY